jgi:hypothetical protein
MDKNNKLSGFSKLPDRVSVQRKPARVPDRVEYHAKVPAGYDPDIWFLAGLWEDLAEKSGGNHPSKPIIYFKLKNRITASGIQTKEVPYAEVDLQDMLQGVHDEMAKRFYDVPVYQLAGPAWRRFIEIMVQEFWTMLWDDKALDDFTEVEYFKGLWEKLVDSHCSRQILLKIELEGRDSDQSGT